MWDKRQVDCHKALQGKVLADSTQTKQPHNPNTFPLTGTGRDWQVFKFNGQAAEIPVDLLHLNMSIYNYLKNQAISNKMWAAYQYILHKPALGYCEQRKNTSGRGDTILITQHATNLKSNNAYLRSY